MGCVRDRLHREIFFFSMLPLFFKGCILVVFSSILENINFARMCTREAGSDRKIKSRARENFGEGRSKFSKIARAQIKTLHATANFFEKFFENRPSLATTSAAKNPPLKTEAAKNLIKSRVKPPQICTNSLTHSLHKI